MVLTYRILPFNFAYRNLVGVEKFLCRKLQFLGIEVLSFLIFDVITSE